MEIILKGTRNCFPRWMGKETYLIAKFKAGVTHTDDGLIITPCSIELSNKLKKLFNVVD